MIYWLYTNGKVVDSKGTPRDLQAHTIYRGEGL